MNDTKGVIFHFFIGSRVTVIIIVTLFLMTFAIFFFSCYHFFNEW